NEPPAAEKAAEPPAPEKKEAAQPIAATATAANPASADKSTAGAVEAAESELESPPPAGVMAALDFNRVIYAGLTLKDAIFILVLVIFAVIFIAIGVSFL